MKRICLFGGANIDLCGASIDKLRSFDSNPGVITISYGGVGRNIAQICSLLQQKVLFVTCFADDTYGKQMKQDCENLGMDCTYSRVYSDVPSSMYLAILDNDHDMKIAMSDMRILSRMDQKMIDDALQTLDKDDIVAVDANLSTDIVAYILAHAQCLTAADPVSASKAFKMKPILSHIGIFKPNQYEAAELNGIEITDEKSASESLEWFRKQGVQEILISMAERGVLLGFDDKRFWLRHRPIALANATGGGDAFMGAYISRRLMKDDPLSSVHYAISAAVTTIEQDAVVRRTLNDEEIRNKMKDMEIREIAL